MKNASDEKIVMTAGETAFIERFVSDYCRPHAEVMRERLAAFVRARQMALFSQPVAFALAAGVATPTPVEVKSPEEEVSFTFASEGDPAAADAWRARVTVPPVATAETALVVEVRTGQGVPAEGTFAVAGTVLPLVEGRAELPFGLFLAGIKDTEVAFQSPAGVKTPGCLMFF